MTRMLKRVTMPVLLLAGILPTVAAGAQQYDRNGNYYRGVQNGGRGGYYDRGRYPQDGRYNNRDDRYYNGYNNRDDRYYQQKQGGIGPGKGALIGGAGGAALGAIFGGGLKGALIGGGAGAGIGAIAGKVHQNHQRRDNGYYRPQPR